MWCEYGGKDRGKAIRCEDGGRGRKREMEIAAFVLCLCLCNMEARMRIGAKLCDVKMEAEKKRDGESSVCRRCSLVAARLCAAGDAQHLRTSSQQL